MSNNGGFIQDDPRRLAKGKFAISAEVHSKGKDHLKDTNGNVQITDQQFADAEILGGAILPASFFLAQPPIGDQGNEGACVAFEAAYARDIAQYVATGASSYSTSVNVFSPEYIYNQAKFAPDCFSGTSVGTALTIIVQQGVCLEATMPYNNGDCTTQPNGTQRTEAALYKISGYTQSWSGDINAVKQLVISGKGVIWNSSADDGLIAATGDYVWCQYSGSGGLPHCFMVFGWDDSKTSPCGSVGAFKCTNSWGTGWGNSGIFWVSYDWFVGAAGYYVYTINGLTASNTAPVARAGFDQTAVTGGTATLDGSGSSDPDGYIAGFAWTQVSGPNTATIGSSSAAVTSVSGLIAGTYVFRLTVTDDDSATATDDVNVVVSSGSTDSISITGITKTSVKGKLTDNISWNITLANFPQSATIEYAAAVGSTWSTIYNIMSFWSPTGTYPAPVASKTRTRYYRLRVTKSDGTVVYSAVKSIK